MTNRNRYFSNLLDFEWGVHKGPGGHFQWKPTARKAAQAQGAAAGEPLPDIMMLTSERAT